MTIKFRCDCGIRIKAPDDLGGKTVRCPACREKLSVPRVGEDPHSYSLEGTEPGDEGWADLPKLRKLSKRKRKLKSGSTYRPTRAVETADISGASIPRERAKKKPRRKRSWLDSFIYPFLGANIFTYIGWTIGMSGFMLIMSMPKFGIFVLVASIVIFLFAAGYFFHFLSEIVRTAAAGEDTLPETSSGEEVFFDAFNWWACVLLCTSPFWGFHLINWWFGLGLRGEIGQLLLIFSILYTPMALLATVLFNTFLAANPVYVLGAIFKCPLHYFISCFLMVTVLFVEEVLELLIAFTLGPENILMFPVIFIISGNMTLYVSIVVMHQLGTVYYRNRKRIGWFRER